MSPTGGRLLVTGGHGALGRALAAAFEAAGWQVAAPGREALDVADRASVAAWFRANAVPDLLVCAAGAAHDRLLARLDAAAWDEALAVNLNGAADCARHALRAMVGRRAGHVVFVSSWSALHPPAGQAAYAAAKAGLIGLGRALAREVGPAGVRVNVILPGFMETRMTGGLAAERVETVRREHVLGRFNRPAAVAEFIRFLHERLPDTSGQVLQLDSRVG